MTGHRFPRRVYDVGKDPDPRFSLANERTFLAWIRTALALSASGVALEAVSLPLQPDLRRAAAVLLLVMGAATPVAAWWMWGLVERALREGSPLPGSRLAPPMAAGVTVVGVLLAVGLLVG